MESLPVCWYCGVHPGRHTFLTPDGGQDDLCDLCLIGLAADTERVGSALEIRVVPAEVPARAR